MGNRTVTRWIETTILGSAQHTYRKVERLKFDCVDRGQATRIVNPAGNMYIAQPFLEREDILDGQDD